MNLSYNAITSIDSLPAFSKVFIFINNNKVIDIVIEQQQNQSSEVIEVSKLSKDYKVGFEL